VGLATAHNRTVAVRVTSRLLTVNRTATSGNVGINRDVSSTDSNSRGRVTLKPDTADIVNVVIVPVALNGVTADLGINVVSEDGNVVNTMISDLKEIIVLGGIVVVVAASVVVIVDVPFVIRDLVTIAESRAIELTRGHRVTGNRRLVGLSLLATTYGSNTTAKMLRLLATVPRVLVAVAPVGVANEFASTLTSVTGAIAFDDVSAAVKLRSNVSVVAREKTQDLTIEASTNRGGSPVNNLEVTIPVGLNTNGTIVLAVENNVISLRIQYSSSTRLANSEN